MLTCVRQIIRENKRTYLDEGFYFLPPRKLLRPHAPGHFPGIPLDASNDSMRIWALFSTIIGLLYDDDLFASLTALEDDSNLSVSPLMAWPRSRTETGTFPGL
jgi:hypothetical protein